MPDVHTTYIRTQDHYFGHRLDPYDLDLRQFVIDNAPGGSGFPASLAADTTVDLNGNSLIFTQSGFVEPLLTLDPAGTTAIHNENSTGGGNNANINVFVNATEADASFGGSFNAGAKFFQIDGVADATTATLGYTAGTHTFTGNVGIGGSPVNLFHVQDGLGGDLIIIDASGFESKFQSDDQTAQTKLQLNANLVGNDVGFELVSDDGTNDVRIDGDAQAQTITLTAANGVIVANNNFQITTPKTPASAAAAGTIGQIAWDTGFIYVCTANNAWERVGISTW